jgi:hypothetical protein
MYVGSEVLTLSVCDRATEGREITRDSCVYLSVTCTNASSFRLLIFLHQPATAGPQSQIKFKRVKVEGRSEARLT